VPLLRNWSAEVPLLLNWYVSRPRVASSNPVAIPFFDPRIPVLLFPRPFSPCLKHQLLPFASSRDPSSRCAVTASRPRVCSSRPPLSPLPSKALPQESLFSSRPFSPCLKNHCRSPHHRPLVQNRCHRLQTSCCLFKIPVAFKNLVATRHCCLVPSIPVPRPFSSCLKN
jgi:hypothetical protein